MIPERGKHTVHMLKNNKSGQVELITPTNPSYTRDRGKKITVGDWLWAKAKDHV
jgi:mannose-6-phosphate isomerase-like protein (cupin superfamily)